MASDTDTAGPAMELHCLECGSSLVDKHKGAKFCSRPCYSAWCWITLICEQCQGEFRVRRSRIEHKNRIGEPVRYCSVRCRGDAVKATHDVKRAPCANGCRRPVPRGRSRYCSRECQFAAGRIECTCQHCGIMFEIQKNMLETGKHSGKFCSPRCAWDGYSRPGLRSSGSCIMCSKSTVKSRKTCSQVCLLNRFRQHQRQLMEAGLLDGEPLDAKECPTCGDWFQPDTQRNRYCSKECQHAGVGVERRGALNHNYIDGTGNYGPGFRTMRLLIRERDGNQCTGCGAANRPVRYAINGDEPRTRSFLQVHHINGDRADSRPENLIALCHPCHLDHHSDDTANEWFSRRATGATRQAPDVWKAKVRAALDGYQPSRLL